MSATLSRTALARQGPRRPTLPAAPSQAVLLPDAGNTWYNDPRAIVFEGTHRKLYAGAITGGGDVLVSSYEFSTGEAVQTLLHGGFEIDDHNNPAILVRASDKRVMCFYSEHSNVGSLHRYRVSINPEDVSSFSAEQTIPNTDNSAYNNPFQMSAESGRIYNFRRDSGFQQSVVYTDDEGGSWSDSIRWLNAPNRPYAKWVSNGTDTLHCWITAGHPREVAQGTNHIYHVVFRGGNFYKADGTTLIRSLAACVSNPMSLSNLTKVYDAAPDGNGNGWTWSIVLDPGHGRPVATFTRFPSIDPDTGRADDHRYCYARQLADLSWEWHEMLTSGPSLYGATTTLEPEYSGGVIVDPRDTSKIWLSRTGATSFEVERWATTDGGVTWALDRRITPGALSTIKNYRPYVPPGAAAGEIDVIWPAGRYTRYTDWSVALMTAPPVKPWPLTAPAVSGVGNVGSLLTVSPGIWSGSPVLTYQWTRDGTPIAGQTATSYTTTGLDDPHTITCEVTGTGPGGTKTYVPTGIAVHSPVVPLDVPSPGLWAWWRASDVLVAADAPIDYWPDSSGAGRPLLQVTGSKQPILKASILNGKAVARFDGANDVMSVAAVLGIAVPSDLSLFVVVKAATAATQTLVSCRISSNTGWTFRLTATGALYFNPGQSPNIADTFTTTGWRLVELVRNGHTIVKTGHDGTMNAPASIADYANTTGVTTTNVGCENTGAGATANPLNGDVAEIVAYSTPLSDANRDLLEAYVATEYGLTIA